MPSCSQRPSPGSRPERLKDPCNDRPMKDVPMPPAELLTADTFWNKKGQPDLDLLQEHLTTEGAVAQELLLDLIRKATELFQAEPNLLKLSDPIAVVGDIHGQFYDMLKLLEVGGKP